MDHVIGRGDDADLLVHGHDQRIVDLEQVVVHRLGMAGIRGLALGEVKVGDETDALAFALDVVVAPLPLVTRDLDGQVGVAGVLLGHHDLGRRQGHEDDDDERHHGPGDFDRDGFMKIGRLVAHGLAVLDDGVEHHAEHGHEDHRADDQHHPVQPTLLGGDARHAGLQVEFADRRSAGQVVDRMRSGHSRSGGPGERTMQQPGRFSSNALHHVHFFKV